MAPGTELRRTAGDWFGSRMTPPQNIVAVMGGVGLGAVGPPGHAPHAQPSGPLMQHLPAPQSQLSPVSLEHFAIKGPMRAAG
jgi:hypothetical protein